MRTFGQDKVTGFAEWTTTLQAFELAGRRRIAFLRTQLLSRENLGTSTCRHTPKVVRGDTELLLEIPNSLLPARYLQCDVASSPGLGQRLVTGS
jgi:hypothetical protein